MRKTLITLIILAAGMMTGQMKAQQLTDRYNESRPLVIACDWDKPPFEFRDDRGEPAGTNVDVLRYICKQLGIPCTFVMKEWGNAIKTFERKEADLILANVKRFRGDEFFATQIINYNRVRVAMTKDTTDVVSLKTLEQQGVVLKTGDYSSMYFRDLDADAMSRIEYQSPKVALTGLLAGDCKYFVWGEEPLKWKIKEFNLEGIYLNDVDIPVSEVHIIGRDKELIDQIDDQYSRLKQSGQLEEMLNKWMHPERVSIKSVPLPYYIILGILLLGLVIYLLSRLAKAHVLSATRNSSELNDMMIKALHMGNFNVMEYDIKADRMTNRYGRILSEEGLSLEEFASRIHPDQQQEFLQKMRLLISGRERRFELNKRWNSGDESQPHWLNFHGHAISELDNDGHPAYIINAIHDVTHEMEEDKSARELVKKYERLENMPSLAMSFYDSEGWLITLNDAMKELCGFNIDDVEAERFWRTLNMFDIPLFRNALSADARDKLIVCQHMYYPDIKVNRYIEFNVLPIVDADGNLANYFDATLEITEKRNRISQIHKLIKQNRKAVESIAQQKRRLIYLLQNSERYIMRSDISQQLVMFYRKPDEPEYIHHFEPFLEMVGEDKREDLRRLLYDDKTETTQYIDINLFRQSQGQTGIFFHITFNPVKDESGRIVGHEGISSDITTFVQARNLLEKQAQLAADSWRLKSGFMASMTHELRTPLNAIVGFSGVLEALGDSEERAEYVRIIRNSSDMLQRLINDIIDASGISDGVMAVHPQTVDFAVAFDDICLTLQQRLQQPSVEFIKDNPFESFITKLDIERVQQVISNFVTNAIKFTYEGHIRVAYCYERQGLYIYCQDTGIGIPKDKQAIVFDRFVKLDEFVQGTGMGLAISKSIVEQCGGEIGVESDGPGKGSTFWMWMPCDNTEIVDK